MPGTTPVYGFPYPEPTDLVADYPALGQQLAEDIEDVLPTIGGLAPATPTSIANSGGTATLSGNTVTFSGVSSVSLNGCFTGDYDNYRVIANVAASTTASITTRLRLSGTDAAGSNYAYRQLYWAGSVAVYSGTATSWGLTPSPGTGVNIAFDCFGPAKAAATRAVLSGAISGAGAGDVNVAEHNLSTAYDGISVLTSAGTITGSLSIYGYRP